MVIDIIRNDEDSEQKIMDECWHRNNGPKWKEAIQTNLKSLTKWEVFGLIVQTLKDIKLVMFIQKHNEKNDSSTRFLLETWYWLVGNILSHYECNHILILISLKILEGLDMCVIMTYLYITINNDIYIKILKGFRLSKENNSNPCNMYSIELKQSLYGLNQSRNMWYNCLSEYLIKERYVNNPLCPHVFIKRLETRFKIITIYVDDLNLVGTPKKLTNMTNYLKWTI